MPGVVTEASNRPALTLAEIEALQPPISTGLTQRICRPLSKHLTWYLLRWGVPAPAVSAANIIVGILAAACLACPHLGVSLLFVPLMYVAEVLDCCDGEVARGSGTSDVTFAFADVAGHYFVTPLVVLALGLRAAVQYQALAPLAAGALAAIFCTPTITLYRVRASILLEELLVRAGNGPVLIHPLLTSRADHLPSDFGFDRPTHRLRLPLGTGMTVIIAAAMLAELVTGWGVLWWVSVATAVAFPLGRVYDYTSSIRTRRLTRELQRILGEEPKPPSGTP
ncbi:MAG: hypothetical protein HYR72_06370 [Deltaproteobacteria bacterium]|nr:hypothetical protein [Deltaproteobacteria bacterium]MBI3387071.1 hypothetical protein [Deltaproteobacteria bacterium]